MNKYHSVTPITKDQAEKIWASENVEQTCEAMVSIALYEEDWKWAQDKFLNFLKNSDPVICGLAATCLGHLARIHRQLEKNKVISALNYNLANEEIKGRIQDALDDINQFTQ